MISLPLEVVNKTRGGGAGGGPTFLPKMPPLFDK
jgi:hypothetical protein